jgi:P pilus assembly chaperone PapD
MKKLLFPILLVLVAALPGRAELGIAMSPMRVEIKIAPGDQYTDAIGVTNDADDPIRARGELLDFAIDETMTPQFEDIIESEAKYSCRDWLQVNPRELDMKPGETVRARYTIRVPAGTPEGEYHCGAGYVSLPPIQKNNTRIGVQIAVRAVAAIYVYVGEPKSAPKFNGISIKPAADGSLVAEALMENQGSKHFRVNGFMEVKDAAGKIVERLDYPTIPVLPGRTQPFPLSLRTSLAPGKYTLRSQTDIGLPEVLVSNMSFAVEKPAAK